MSRRERQRRRRHNRGHPLGRVLLMTGILTICGVAIAALLAVGWVVATADSAPNLSQLPIRHANPPTAIYASDGSLLGYVHTDTIYNHVAPTQRNALVGISVSHTGKIAVSTGRLANF